MKRIIRMVFIVVLATTVVSCTKDVNIGNTTNTVLKQTPFTYEITTGNIGLQGQNTDAYNLDGDSTVSSSSNDDIKFIVNIDSISFTGSWESKNGTIFVKDNNFDYTNATIESATDAYTTGTPTETVTNPVVDDIYIAENHSKHEVKYYVIKIDNINLINGELNFSYKKN